jgi:hypothetical protein
MMSTQNDSRTEAVAAPQGVERECNDDGGLFRLVSRFVVSRGHVYIHKGKRAGR